MSNQYSSFNGKGALFSGLYGGWMMNHRFMLGLGAYGLMTKQDGYNANGETDKKNELHMAYGGLMMEYTFASTKKIHASTNLLLGGGGVSNGYYEPHQGGYGSNFSVVDESGLYVIQPSVSVEVNVTDWFRVGVGAGYRHITGSDMIAISDKEMSAPSQSFS